jgi:hypothetical protein
VRCLLKYLLPAVLVLTGASLYAKSKSGLGPYAGSYTGTATSSIADGPLSGPATLTFTGREKSLRGTFLYTGILNSGNMPRNVVQTLNISSKGILSGRVTVDNVDGTASGQVRMRGKKLTVAVTYTLTTGTTINLAGTIAFHGKRATWITPVSSSDAGYSGSLVVKGKR